MDKILYIIMFFAFVLVTIILTIVGILIFTLLGKESLINTPIFYLVFGLIWSLVIIRIVDKFIKDEE